MNKRSRTQEMYGTQHDWEVYFPKLQNFPHNTPNLIDNRTLMELTHAPQTLKGKQEAKKNFSSNPNGT
jgi:hypothetical protein